MRFEGKFRISNEVLLSVKSFFESFGVFLSVFVDDMGVDVRYHADLGVAGISLDRLDVAAVELEFVGHAGMTEAVKHDFRQIVLVSLYSISAFRAFASALVV